MAARGGWRWWMPPQCHSPCALVATVSSRTWGWWWRWTSRGGPRLTAPSNLPDGKQVNEQVEPVSLLKTQCGMGFLKGSFLVAKNKRLNISNSRAAESIFTWSKNTGVSFPGYCLFQCAHQTVLPRLSGADLAAAVLLVTIWACFARSTILLRLLWREPVSVGLVRPQMP